LYAGTPTEVLAESQTVSAEIIPYFPEILVGIQEIALKQAIPHLSQSYPLIIHDRLSITHDLQVETA
jgi:hypothetical protein